MILGDFLIKAMPDNSQIFTLLFLMLGPFKIIAPFLKITKNADAALTRKLALYGILYSIIALLLAAILGEKILSNFSIPVPILALSGGIIFFLVALLNVLSHPLPTEAEEKNLTPPSPKVAMTPLAFPTIVTPYGMAAVIVLIALSPDLREKLIVGATVGVIMVLNLLIMLLARSLMKPLAVLLPILGEILSVIQVALAAKIIYNSLITLLAR
jgi:multiple antibiotic resistance protein